MSANTAFVIIDVQVGMFDESGPVFQGEQLLSKLQDLIEKARAKGIPIFYVRHNEGPGENRLIGGMDQITDNTDFRLLCR